MNVRGLVKFQGRICANQLKKVYKLIQSDINSVNVFVKIVKLEFVLELEMLLTIVFKGGQVLNGIVNYTIKTLIIL